MMTLIGFGDPGDPVDHMSADIVISGGRVLKMQSTLPGGYKDALVLILPSSEDDDGWDWQIVEIMGHRTHVGRCREVERYGVKQIRVDVPIYEIKSVVTDPAAETAGDASNHKPVAEFSRWESHFYGGQAIFSTTPTDEATVREYARRAALRDAPSTYRLVDHRRADDQEDFDDVC